MACRHTLRTRPAFPLEGLAEGLAAVDESDHGGRAKPESRGRGRAILPAANAHKPGGFVRAAARPGSRLGERRFQGSRRTSRRLSAPPPSSKAPSAKAPSAKAPSSKAEATTLSAQIEKLKRRFGLDRVVLVGDRGMITSARMREDLEPAGLDWITALRAPQIRALVNQGPMQLGLFGDRDLAEITAPDYPGERLVVGRNAALAAERARKREDLLAATERALSRIIENFGIPCH